MNSIIDAVKRQPGRTAKEIATELGLRRREVHATLKSHSGKSVRQDETYCWYPLGEDAGRPAANSSQKVLMPSDPLSSLCAYYLDCLSRDDSAEISVLADGRPPADYVELSPKDFPGGGGSVFDNPEGQRLWADVRKRPRERVLRVGYPVQVRRARRSGYLVEPVLVWTIDVGRPGLSVLPDVSEAYPQLNAAFLEAHCVGGSADSESFALIEVLGLDGKASTVAPPLDELVDRLHQHRAYWPWRSHPDPYALEGGPRISELRTEGIYNRAVLIATDRSPFTRGLESELAKLRSTSQSAHANTALGAWLDGTLLDESPIPQGQPPLLEVTPLNTEQREAVTRGLHRPLTVVTGPPGTGKSQVVTNLLVNAAWRGQTVLFASKNHKAVDVVEGRINAFGNRPLLLRYGKKEMQRYLSEYLTNLLSSRTQQSDETGYRQALQRYGSLATSFAQVDSVTSQVVDARNTLARIEDQTSVARETLGGERFALLREWEPAKLAAAVDGMASAVDRADPSLAKAAARLFWFATRKKRLADLAAAADASEAALHALGARIPDAAEDIEAWRESLNVARSNLGHAAAVRAYFDALAALNSLPPLEVQDRARLDQQRAMATQCEALWHLWLRCMPSRLSSAERQSLGRYASLLRLIAEGGERPDNRRTWAEFLRAFPHVLSALPCWAITSLSARKIPFEPGFFDLLVVDEASQCDIASIVPLLHRSKRAVIIGDPNQLQHICKLSPAEDEMLMERHGLLAEHAEWNYSRNSIFNLAITRSSAEDVVVLRDHHRSHADIIKFANREFYDGRLRVATRYEGLKRPRIGNALRWLDVRTRSERPPDGSLVNPDEASAVVRELERLLIDQKYPGTVGVVTPFRGQANRIRDMAHAHPSLGPVLVDRGFTADTVHAFQGDERDVIFMSPTVSDGTPPQTARWLAEQRHVFNVAITRARAALIVVGNKQAGDLLDIPLLSRLADYAAECESVEAPRPPEDGPGDLGPDYPSVPNPEHVSEWERTFYRVLHKAGIRCVPQYPADKYRLDLAVFSGGRRLDIEVDGEHHRDPWTGEHCRQDQIRNQRLMELGWDVMRFWVYQLRDDMNVCVARVQAWIDAQPSTTGPGEHPDPATAQ